jgi:hypothetical protein
VIHTQGLKLNIIWCVDNLKHFVKLSRLKSQSGIPVAVHVYYIFSKGIECSCSSLRLLSLIVVIKCGVA